MSSIAVEKKDPWLLLQTPLLTTFHLEKLPIMEMMGGPKIINSPQRVVGLMETFSIMRIKFEASFEICVILNP